MSITDNSAWPNAKPLISVLVPFHRDDPRPLLSVLAAQAQADVELIVLDDGSNDSELTAAVARDIEAAPMAARLIALSANEGRAKGRNRLAANARGRWLLFLDADMLPDSPQFLAEWLKLVRSQGPAVAFGGLSVDQAPPNRQTALHRAMSRHSDCIDVDSRRRQPEKYVFTSNLLVRRDVFAAEGFDEGFSGWGWEDVEWAMRVSRTHSIVHIDDTATHLGLDPARTIAAKYEQSAANFARVVASHRDVVSAYPSYKAARVLGRIPLRGLWRPVVKQVALADILPLSLRAFSMRLYRAALYAEAV